MIAGQLEIQMLADLARLKSDMDQAKSLVGGAMGEIERMAGLATRALGALGVGLSIAGLMDLVKGAIEGAAGLHQLSEQTGVSVESLSALRSVAKLSGTSMEDVRTALQKLSKNMVEAQSGTGAAAEQFHKLGVNILDSNGKLKTADQVFLDVAKSLNTFEDGATTTTAKTILLGRAGANLAPVMNDLVEKGNLVGKVTAEQARQADEYEKKIIKLQSAIKGWFTSVALDLLPVLSKLGGLMEVALKVGAAYVTLFVALPALVSAAGVAFDAFAVAVVEGATAQSIFAASLAATVNGTKAAVLQFGLLKTAGALALAAFAGWEIGTWLRENFVEAQLAGIAFVDGMLTGWEQVKYGAQVAWLGIKTVVFGALAGITDKFADAVAGVASGMRAMGLTSAADATAKFAEQLKAASANSVDFTGELAKLTVERDKNIAGVREITDAMADEAIANSKSTEEQKKKKKALEGTTEAAMAQRNEYIKLIATIREKTAANNLEASLGRQLNEVEKIQLDIEKKVEAGTVTRAQAESKLTKEVVARYQASELLKTSTLAQAKADDESWKAMQKLVEEMDKSTRSISDQVEKQQAANATTLTGIDYTGQYELAQLRAAAAVKEREAALELEDNAESELGKRYLANADALRQLASEKEKQPMLKAAHDAIDAWQKSFEQLTTGLSEAITHGWSGAMSFIKQAAKTEVVKFFVQPVMGSALGGLGALAGAFMPASAGAGTGIEGAGSGSGVVGGALNLASMFGTGGVVSTAGSYAATGFMSSVTGTGLGTTLGASSALAEGGSMAAGAGMAIGAIAPYLIAIYAIYKLLTADHDAKLGYGSAQLGADGTLSAAGRLMSFGRGADVGAQDQLVTLAQQVLMGVAGSAKAFGGSAIGLQVQASTDMDLSGQGAASIQFLRDGGRLGGVQTGGTNPLAAAASKIDQGDIAKWLADNTSAAMIAGLQQSDLPKRFADFFSSVDAFKLSGEQAQAMLTAAANVKTLTDVLAPLGSVFGQLGSLSVEATLGLAQLTGGFDQLISKSNAYVQAFYSDQEQTSIAATQVQKALKDAGIDTSMLTDKASFRAAVDATGSIIGSSAGQQQLAAYLNVAQQFAAIADKFGGLSLDQVAAAAPQDALLQQLQSPTEATAAATQATAEATTTVAENTADTAAAVAEVADATDLQTSALAAGFKLLADKLDKLLVTLTDIDRLSTQAEARAAGGQG